jgi:hypothetical protein
MPSLDDVTQTFEADVAPYIAALERAIATTKEFADAVREAGLAATEFGMQSKVAAEMLASMEESETLLMGISNLLAGSLHELQDAVDSLERSEVTLDGVSMSLNNIMGELRGTADSLAMIERLLAEQLGVATRQMAYQMAMAMALRSALSGMSKATVDTGTTAAATGGIIAQWWSQWGSVVHWVVMSTLEIAATAIPAIVALAAAAIAMYPTFVHIYDVMNNLYTSAGSLSGAFANSVGPLRAMGAAGQTLRNAVAPDAYIIFGSAINALTGHVGAFSQIARQASDVLAQFASKLSGELAGPLGGQLTGFFQGAVGYMIQWGQVLGQLGHIFVNVMAAFWGTSHVLLGVLDEISRVLVALTSNPAVAWLIGLASAASAAYRWGRLMKDAWAWLGGDAAFKGLKTGIAWLGAYIAELGIMITELGYADTAMIVFQALMGPEIFLLIALGAAITAVVLSQHQAASSTQNLIAQVNKMSPSASNFALGIQIMEGNILGLSSQLDKNSGSVVKATQGYNRFGTAQEDAALKTQASLKAMQQSTQEITKLANEGVNLATGLAQAGQRSGALGADMNAMSIQTSIADSKIQNVNQALDQYIGLLTSGTSGNANFITSLANIGTVSATTTNNLGTNTTQLTLTTQTFGKALTNMGTVGAAAWQNFDQVLTGSMQPLMDNLRQLGVTGAITGQQVSQAAIDMAVQLGRYAGSNKTAQAQVMGFLRAQGLTFPSFQKFMQGAGSSAHAQRSLNDIISKGTIAFSQLSQMAKNAATAMNPMVAQAIDAAALKASGFNSKLGKLQTDMMNGAPAATLAQDMAGVDAAYQTALQMAQSTGQGMTTASTTAAGNIHTNSQKMASAWDTAKLHQLGLQGQVQSSGTAIAGHASSVAGSTQRAMSQMAAAFDMSRAHAQQLQNFIDSMHGKTINVTTVFSSSGKPSNVLGTGGFHGGVVGYAGGGMVGGPIGMDAVPAWLTHGEGVLTAAAVSALGGPLAIHSLNSTPQAALGMGGGGGSQAIQMNLHVPVMLDGRQIATGNRTETLIYNRRNPSNNLSLRTR